MTIWIASLSLLILVVLLVMPRSAEVTGSTLKVRTWLLSKEFDLQKAVAVTPVSREDLRSWKTLRLFGIGWPFRPSGLFYTFGYGMFLYLARDTQNMRLIKFPRLGIIASV